MNLDHPDQRAEIVAERTALRRAGQGRCQAMRRRCRPPARQRSGAYAAAGATSWLVEFPWEAVSVDQVRGVIRDGPAASP